MGKKKKGVRNLFRSTPQGKQVRKHCETKAPVVQQRPEKVPDPFLPSSPMANPKSNFLSGKKGVRNLFRSTPQGKQVRKHCEAKAPVVQQRPEKVPDPFFLFPPSLGVEHDDKA
jgi:hypothetical protein